MCVIFMKKRFTKKFVNDRNYWKVSDLCYFTSKYWGAAHRICNLKFNMPNKIPVVFHEDSNYDYHLIIQELEKEFEGEFECLGENTCKCKNFSISIQKEI